MTGACAKPAAAVAPEEVERMPERPPSAVPGEGEMGEGDGLVADGVAQGAGEVLDSEGAVGRFRRVFVEPCGDTSRWFTQRRDEQRHRVLRIGREHQIDRRQTLL